MAFDYKKEYKEFYLPPRKPGIVTVPPMNFVSVLNKCLGTPWSHFLRVLVTASADL